MLPKIRSTLIGVVTQNMDRDGYLSESYNKAQVFLPIGTRQYFLLGKILAFPPEHPG